MAKLSTPAKLGLAAAALGAAALFNRSRTKAAEAQTPPIGKFVEVDGLRLHYVERGDGQPIVMLHGMGALIQDFDGSGLIDRAAERYRVLAFDRPGYGYSDRPRDTNWTPERQAALIRAALAKLGVERPIVLGHSWGTLVALAFALDFPGEASGLVLLSGYYFATPRPDSILLGGPALPYLGPVIANTASPLLGRAAKKLVFKQIFAPMDVPDRFVDLFPTEMTLRPGHIQAAAGDAAQLQLGAVKLAKRYRELTMPISIVSGEGDKIVAHGTQAEQLRDTLPQAHFHAVPGTGHMIHWVALDEVMDAIDAVGAAVAQSARLREPA